MTEPQPSIVHVTIGPKTTDEWRYLLQVYKNSLLSHLNHTLMANHMLDAVTRNEWLTNEVTIQGYEYLDEVVQADIATHESSMARLQEGIDEIQRYLDAVEEQEQG